MIFKLIKYKLLSRICFGKIRGKYKGKYNKLYNELFNYCSVPLKFQRSDLHFCKNTLVAGDDFLQIGHNCWFGPNCEIVAGPGAGIKIGNNVFVGLGFNAFNNNHRFENSKLLPFNNEHISRPIEIGDNVWIGMRVIILPGVKVGGGAVIAAGSVVTKSVPECAIAAGNPAKIIGFRDKEQYKKLVEEKKFLGIHDLDNINDCEFIIENKFNKYMT